MKRATILHDQANLFLLPILGCATALGLFGYVDPVKVTILFTWYIVADFAWIFAEPNAVPSLPNVILLHHAVTFVLLCFPLQYTHLATYTCWDGICEINTFFLIARRQWKSVRRPFTILYWATFFPMRIFLYPYMLIVFYKEMQIHETWELLTVCACQIVLIAFNVVLLALSIGNWKKRAGGSKSGAGTQSFPGAATVGMATGVKKKAAGKRMISAQAVVAAPISPKTERA